VDGDPTLWWKVGFKGRPNDRDHRKSHLLWAGVLCRVATHLARSASPDGPLWVTGGKTRSEYIFSEFPQVADIAGARSGSRLPPPKRNAAASTASTDQQAHELQTIHVKDEQGRIVSSWQRVRVSVPDGILASLPPPYTGRRHRARISPVSQAPSGS